jgi:hypothetical protein
VTSPGDKDGDKAFSKNAETGSLTGVLLYVSPNNIEHPIDDICRASEGKETEEGAKGVGKWCSESNR